MGFGAPQSLGADFSGTFVFAAGARLTVASGGSGGAHAISDHAGG